jgi:hypothetical protein
MGKGGKDRVNRDSKENRYDREGSRQEQKETRENSNGRAKAKTATGAGGKGRETRDGRENRVGREEGNSNAVAKGSVNNSKGPKATGDSRGVRKKRQEKTVTDGQRRKHRRVQVAKAGRPEMAGRIESAGRKATATR